MVVVYLIIGPICGLLSFAGFMILGNQLADALLMAWAVGCLGIVLWAVCHIIWKRLTHQQKFQEKADNALE